MEKLGKWAEQRRPGVGRSICPSHPAWNKLSLSRFVMAQSRVSRVMMNIWSSHPIVQVFYQNKCNNTIILLVFHPYEDTYHVRLNLWPNTVWKHDSEFITNSSVCVSINRCFLVRTVAALNCHAKEKVCLPKSSRRLTMSFNKYVMWKKTIIYI